MKRSWSSNRFQGRIDGRSQDGCGNSMLIFECRLNVFIWNMTDDYVFFGQKPFFLLKSGICDGIYTKVKLQFSLVDQTLSYVSLLS